MTPEPFADVAIKLAAQGGPVLATIVVLTVLVVKYLIPLVKEAMQVHQADIQRVLDANRVGQAEVISAFRDTLDRSERATNAIVGGLTEKIGGEVKGIRQDLDKVSDTLDGIRRDLADVKTGEFRRLSTAKGE